MEIRLLLAFLLTGVFLFLTPYVYQKLYPPPPRPAQTPAVRQAAEAPKSETPPAAKPAKPGKPAAPAPAIAAAAKETATIDTDLYRVELSNAGGVVTKWELKKYRDSNGNLVELVNTNPAAIERVGYPFQYQFKEDPRLGVDPNKTLFKVSRPDPLTVEFTFSTAGGVSAVKRFGFKKASYSFDFTSELKRGQQFVPHWVAWRGGFGDPTVAQAASKIHGLYYDTGESKLRALDVKAAEQPPVVSYSFAGIQDTYFAAVFLPAGKFGVEVKTLNDTVPGEKVIKGTEPKDEPHAGAAIGRADTAGAAEFSVFVGPKDLDVLRSVGAPHLEQVVDFGTWFGFIAKPLFYILNYIDHNFTHNYGWAIVVVTLFINFALLPLRLSSMKSMKKMQTLQPQIKAINDKYKGISLRDPRKAQQNQEVMELYKKHGVNPAGGCLPMLLQIPFFIGFYNVLTVVIEMRGATWMWLKDLSAPDPFYILPVVMTVSQIAMQKMTPTTAADPTQQKMMMLMPLVFGYFSLWFSSGLVLYWLTSNAIGIGQQWFLNKTGGAKSAAAPAVVKSETSRKRRASR